MLNQDKKLNFTVRKNRPQTLASVFGGFIDMLGGRVADADLAKNWSNILGKDVVKIANLVAVKQNKNKKLNIVLRPVSSAFALELSYKLDEIKNKINKYYGYDAVGKITIRK
jgi:hypothetical protein